MLPMTITLAPIDLSSNNLPLAWKKWLTKLKVYLRANNLENETDSRQDSMNEAADNQVEGVQLQQDNMKIVSPCMADETNTPFKTNLFIMKSYQHQGDIPSISQPTKIVTLRKKKLIRQLQRKTLLAD
ncbi:unnamed protein product [Euphydryas editha]|uniref:Uncharacterized protein n=1 Tax=Euphydryas editha TaxID=104508 RepID=A0AAU9TPY1_EUPED|nr:unnamed protein product [Euphydryas editha]